LRYGFKAFAEKLAAQERTAVGLSLHDRFDPWNFATYMQVCVLAYDELQLSADHSEQLTKVDVGSWSGVTLSEAGKYFVVLNPKHDLRRQRNTLTHELAHITLGHIANRIEVSNSGAILLGEYADDQEQEADWLSGTLLMPRDGILKLRKKGVSAEQIADHFQVSKDLCEWRLRMTGIDRQLKK
jgi:Zn-dependent peptidase ImmA (M78 family)